jgi:hypothetical protein
MLEIILMHRISKIMSFFAVLLFFPISAHAYLDPGAGSALIQGILGAVAALGVVLKLYWHRILKFIGLRKSKDEENSADLKKENNGKDRP